MRKSTALGVVLASVFLAYASSGEARAGWTTTNVDELNSAYHDGFSTVSADGRTMYFASDRPGGFGTPALGTPWPFAAFDIYVSRRASTAAPWGAPVNLGPKINTAGNEHSVILSPDHHYMFFSTDRPGGCGMTDIWFSYRANVNSDLGWREPQHIPCAGLPGGINGAFIDSCPNLDADPGDDTARFYWVSAATADPVSLDIKVASLDLKKRKFGQPAVVGGGINSPFSEGHLDPMHGYMWVTYPDEGTPFGDSDIYITHRTAGGWAPGVDAGPEINSPFEEHLPSLTADGNTLFFASDRPGGHGNLDLYEASR